MPSSKRPFVRFASRPGTVLRYTNGECGALAEAIHKRTGWPIHVLKERGIRLHAVVKTPDGRYLDVEGLWPRDLLLRHWRATSLAPVGRKVWESSYQLWHDGYYTSARHLARRVIARALREGVTQ